MDWKKPWVTRIADGPRDTVRAEVTADCMPARPRSQGSLDIVVPSNCASTPVSVRGRAQADQTHMSDRTAVAIW